MTVYGGHRGKKREIRACIDCGRPVGRHSKGRCPTCGHKGLLRTCPEDFVVELKRLGGSKAAAAHYQASLKTITRWRTESGLTFGRRVKKRPRGVGFGRPGGLPRVEIFRDMSAPGHAADFLRRYGAVFRCDENRKPNAKGGFWNRNGRVLTDTDIMERAERLGWKRPEGVFSQ